MTEENQMIDDEQYTVTEQISDNIDGKAVFALISLVVADGKEYQDGYLLFKNPNSAMDLVKTCKENVLNSNTNPQAINKFMQKNLALYKPFQWINVNDFYATHIYSKGSFFVRDLSDCCNSITQDTSLNEDKSHPIFSFFPEKSATE